MRRRRGRGRREENVEAIRDAGRRCGGAHGAAPRLQPQGRRHPRVDLNQAVLRRAPPPRILGEDTSLSSTLAHPCVVRGRPSVDQVLMNLRVNARDAMPRGGTLALSTATATVRSGEHAGQWAELRVADSGAGMDGATRAHLPSPSSPPRASAGAPGSASRWSTASWRRRAGTSGRERGGRRHHLPRPPPDRRAAPSAANPRPAQPEGRQARDRPRRRGRRRRCGASCARRSRSLGYRVLAARDGESALAAARFARRADPPAGHRRGDAARQRARVVDRLRATRPRVLFLSGYADDAMVRHGVAAGRRPSSRSPSPPNGSRGPSAGRSTDAPLDRVRRRRVTRRAAPGAPRSPQRAGADRPLRAPVPVDRSRRARVDVSADVWLGRETSRRSGRRSLPVGASRRRGRPAISRAMARPSPRHRPRALSRPR